jgi:hypothetical protein
MNTDDLSGFEYLFEQKQMGYRNETQVEGEVARFYGMRQK